MISKTTKGIQTRKHECHVLHVSGFWQPIRTNTSFLTLNALCRVTTHRHHPLRIAGPPNASYYLQNNNYSPVRAVPYCCQPPRTRMTASCVNADFLVSPDPFLNLDWLLGSSSHCTICSSSTVVQNRSSLWRLVGIIVVGIFKNKGVGGSRSELVVTWQKVM